MLLVLPVSLVTAFLTSTSISIFLASSPTSSSSSISAALRELDLSDVLGGRLRLQVIRRPNLVVAAAASRGPTAPASLRERKEEEFSSRSKQ